MRRGVPPAGTEHTSVQPRLVGAPATGRSGKRSQPDGRIPLAVKPSPPKADYGRRNRPPSRREFSSTRGTATRPSSMAGPIRLPGRSGSLGARAAAHHAERLRPDLARFLGAFAHLVALVEQFDLLHLLEGLVESRFGVLELDLQVVRRALEVVAALDRGLCIGWIGEMTWIVNTGAILFGLDLAFEIAADALELADHGLDLGDPTPPLVNLKFFQANECLS